MNRIRNYINSIQKAQANRTFHLPEESIVKVHSLLYNEYIINDKTDAQIKALCTKEEYKYFEKFIAIGKEKAFFKERLLNNQIKPTSLQNPNDFFTLLKLFEIGKNNSESVKSLFEKNNYNITIATESSFHSHAKIFAEENDVGILLTRYLIFGIYELAWFASLLLNRVMKEFSISVDKIETVTMSHVDAILKKSPHLQTLLERLLVTSVATEQYNVSKEFIPDSIFQNVSYAIQLFIFNHEIGHLIAGHFKKENPKNHLSRENFESLYKKVIKFVGDEKKAEELVVYYLREFKDMHLDEIEADYMGLLITLEILHKSKVDITYGWIGSCLALYLIKFIERVNFMFDNGFDYINFVKEPFVIDVLFPSSHPRSNTRLHYLLSHADLYGKFEEQHRELAQALHIPFSRAGQAAVEILKQLKETDDEFIIHFNPEGRLVFDMTWKEFRSMSKEEKYKMIYKHSSEQRL